VFATYNKSKITRLSFAGRTMKIELQNKKHILKVTAVQQNNGTLKAPVTGQMNRFIKESIDSEIEIQLSYLNGKTTSRAKGKHAGMEIIEKILTYF